MKSHPNLFSDDLYKKINFITNHQNKNKLPSEFTDWIYMGIIETNSYVMGADVGKLIQDQRCYRYDIP